MNSERPVIRDLERSGADITLEVLAYLGVILLVGISAYYYRRLPETVPHAISRQMLSAVKLALVATFTYVTWSLIATALGNQHGLGIGFKMVEPPLLFAILGFYLFRAKRAR